MDCCSPFPLPPHVDQGSLMTLLCFGERFEGCYKKQSSETVIYAYRRDIVEDIVHILTDAILVRFHRVGSSDVKS